MLQTDRLKGIAKIIMLLGGYDAATPFPRSGREDGETVGRRAVKEHRLDFEVCVTSYIGNFYSKMEIYE